MELSARYLRDEVEFKRVVRGYDMDEVDDLLDQVADWVDQLHDRLRQVTERAARAEQRATEGADTEDALRRTLVLAQRTADEAVKEAEARAAALVAEAEAKAATAEADAAALARKVAEDAQRQLRADIAALEKARATLQADVAALEGFLDSERTRLRELFTEQLQRLDAVSGATLGSTPVVHDVVVPAELEAAAPIEEDVVDDAVAEVDVGADEELEEVDLEDELDDEVDTVAVPEAPAPRDGAPGPGAPSDDDPFLRELRKAVYDRDPLGPRPDDAVAHRGDGGDVEHDLDVPDRPRRGLRRRR